MGSLLSSHPLKMNGFPQYTYEEYHADDTLTTIAEKRLNEQAKN